MPWTSKHTEWLVDTGQHLKTADGKEVELWEFQHYNDEDVLSAWAKHFRNHYCLDAEIDIFSEANSLAKIILIVSNSLPLHQSLVPVFERETLEKFLLPITFSGV